MGNNFFIHESSYIDGNVFIGERTKVWHFSHIQEGAIIGKNCTIGQNVNIAPNVIIGDNVKIQNNVSVYTGVTVEDDVFIGPSVVFTNVINPRSFIERKDKFKKTLIEKGSSIGANATIICGVIIGSYSFIGAGSVVTKDILSYAICYGVSAKRKGWICECGNKLSRMIKRKWYCAVCDKIYKYDWHNLYRLK
jgi:UDP-2-acetamido-3-amino-2,3-dideoxy-glucuronate N-acetyltransferase